MKLAETEMGIDTKLCETGRSPRLDPGELFACQRCSCVLKGSEGKNVLNRPYGEYCTSTRPRRRWIVRHSCAWGIFGPPVPGVGGSR
jgi:hypothetical protein